MNKELEARFAHRMPADRNLRPIAAALYRASFGLDLPKGTSVRWAWAAIEPRGSCETHGCYWPNSKRVLISYREMAYAWGSPRGLGSGRADILTTLIHELAHVRLWDLHRGEVDEHGPEFQAAYESALEACWKAAA